MRLWRSKWQPIEVLTRSRRGFHTVFVRFSKLSKIKNISHHLLFLPTPHIVVGCQPNQVQTRARTNCHISQLSHQIISAQIVPNETGGSGCTYSEICMVGVLGCGRSDDVHMEKWGVSSNPGTPSNSSTAHHSTVAWKNVVSKFTWQSEKRREHQRNADWKCEYIVAREYYNSPGQVPPSRSNYTNSDPLKRVNKFEIKKGMKWCHIQRPANLKQRNIRERQQIWKTKFII